MGLGGIGGPEAVKSWFSLRVRAGESGQVVVRLDGGPLHCSMMGCGPVRVGGVRESVRHFI